MLCAWAKQEGDGATREEIIYVLEGLVASKVISKSPHEDVFN